MEKLVRARIEQFLESKSQEVIDLFLPMYEACDSLADGHSQTRYQMLLDMEAFLKSGRIEEIIQQKKDGTLEEPKGDAVWRFID
jgi:hypothetical protein